MLLLFSFLWASIENMKMHWKYENIFHGIFIPILDQMVELASPVGLFALLIVTFFLQILIKCMCVNISMNELVTSVGVKISHTSQTRFWLLRTKNILFFSSSSCFFPIYQTVNSLLMSICSQFQVRAKNFVWRVLLQRQLLKWDSTWPSLSHSG